jgi:hypothetical protein
MYPDYDMVFKINACLVLDLWSSVLWIWIRIRIWIGSGFNEIPGSGEIQTQIQESKSDPEK